MRKVEMNLFKDKSQSKFKTRSLRQCLTHVGAGAGRGFVEETDDRAVGGLNAVLLSRCFLDLRGIGDCR